VPYLAVINVQDRHLWLDTVKNIAATKAEIDDIDYCQATSFSQKVRRDNSGAGACGVANSKTAFTRTTFSGYA
jgi:hypothetical protein